MGTSFAVRRMKSNVSRNVPCAAIILNGTAWFMGADALTDSRYLSAAFSLVESIRIVPNVPELSEIVIKGSVDERVEVRDVKFWPPTFFRKAVRSTVSPASSWPLLLPPVS